MHPEADALLNAIWDNPADDTPRLVYADWLQEQGFEDYAQFIRLCVSLKRQTLPADERSRLRRERFLLGQAVIKAHPQAAGVFANRHPPDGIPDESYSAAAEVFLADQPDWSLFHCPRRLSVVHLRGYEHELGTCERLRRIVVLQCEGNVTNNWGHWREAMEWQPVSSSLLVGLASNPHLGRLKSLWVDPIDAGMPSLLSLAETPLARQLEHLRLWVQFPDGTREDLEVDGGVPAGVREFVSHHAGRFIVPAG